MTRTAALYRLQNSWIVQRQLVCTMERRRQLYCSNVGAMQRGNTEKYHVVLIRKSNLNSTAASRAGLFSPSAAFFQYRMGVFR